VLSQEASLYSDRLVGKFEQFKKGKVYDAVFVSKKNNFEI